MQVGAESKAEDRQKFEWASFKILSVEVNPVRLADTKEEKGSHTVQGKVIGDFNLHGITSSKTLAFTAMIQGPVEKPTGISFRSDTPFEISLKEHDIKPRDAVGTFLEGALERVGKKIVDRVQVSLEVEAGN